MSCKIINLYFESKETFNEDEFIKGYSAALQAGCINAEHTLFYDAFTKKYFCPICDLAYLKSE